MCEATFSQFSIICMDKEMISVSDDDLTACARMPRKKREKKTPNEDSVAAN